MLSCKLVCLCRLTRQLMWHSSLLCCLQGEVERAASEGNAWDSGDGAGYRVTFITADGCLSGTNSQAGALITSVLAWACSMLAVQASAVSPSCQAPVPGLCDDSSANNTKVVCPSYI